MGIILFITIIVFILLGRRFYLNQNTKNKIGGPISKPKAFWLFFALYSYFAFGLLVWWQCYDAKLSSLLTIFIGLMYGRAIIQPIIMYITRSWTPYYGMGFNIAVAGFVITGLLRSHYHNHEWATCDQLITIYLAMVSALLLTDTYYARVFHKIVGNRTTGTDAIWYASEEDDRFDSINNITWMMNWVYGGLLVVLIGILVCNV